MWVRRLYLARAARWRAPAIQLTGLAKKGLKVVLRGGDTANAELFHQHLGHIGRKESGQRGANVDVLYAQSQQGQQHDNGLLLVPWGRLVRDWRVVNVRISIKCVSREVLI